MAAEGEEMTEEAVAGPKTRALPVLVKTSQLAPSWAVRQEKPAACCPVHSLR